jgi:hypothetical protein
MTPRCSIIFAAALALALSACGHAQRAPAGRLGPQPGEAEPQPSTSGTAAPDGESAPGELGALRSEASAQARPASAAAVEGEAAPTPPAREEGPAGSDDGSPPVARDSTEPGGIQSDAASEGSGTTTEVAIEAAPVAVGTEDEPTTEHAEGPRASGAKRGAGKGALYGIGFFFRVVGGVCVATGPLAPVCFVALIYFWPYTLAATAASAALGAAVGAGVGAIAAAPAAAAPVSATSEPSAVPAAAVPDPPPDPVDPDPRSYPAPSWGVVPSSR